MKRRRRFITIFLILIVTGLVFIFAPFFARTRARLVTGVYDRLNEQNSVAKATGLQISFPLDGMALFPVLITYNDNGVSGVLGKPVQFTVDYAFGDFRPGNGYSRIYDDGDPLYNAYFGYYSLTGYGTSLADSDLMKLTEYDMIDLALPASGLTQDQGIFKISEQELRIQDLVISSYPFAAYESSVLTNGPDHGATKFLPQNLFFGNPPVPAANYPLVEMKGKIYSYYFPEKDLNLAFYALATSDAVLNEFEASILKEVVISFNK